MITFGAPRAGDAEWAETLTTNGLDSDFFRSKVGQIDSSAFTGTDPALVPRLLDPRRPAGFRVLISTDPITSGTLTGGKHVGKTVYANAGCGRYLLGLPDIDSHKP